VAAIHDGVRLVLADRGIVRQAQIFGFGVVAESESVSCVADYGDSHGGAFLPVVNLSASIVSTLRQLVNSDSAKFA
jgi:hypothetical protein